jgi:hypothetical protein
MISWNDVYSGHTTALSFIRNTLALAVSIKVQSLILYSRRKFIDKRLDRNRQIIRKRMKGYNSFTVILNGG